MGQELGKDRGQRVTGDRGVQNTGGDRRQRGTGDSFQLLLICFIFANCALNINIFFNSLIKDLVNNDLEQIIDIYFKYIFHVHDLNRTI